MRIDILERKRVIRREGERSASRQGEVKKAELKSQRMEQEK